MEVFTFMIEIKHHHKFVLYYINLTPISHLTPFYGHLEIGTSGKPSMNPTFHNPGKYKVTSTYYKVCFVLQVRSHTHCLIFCFKLSCSLSFRISNLSSYPDPTNL